MPSEQNVPKMSIKYHIHKDREENNYKNNSQSICIYSPSEFLLIVTFVTSRAMLRRVTLCCGGRSNKVCLTTPLTILRSRQIHYHQIKYPTVSSPCESHIVRWRWTQWRWWICIWRKYNNYQSSTGWCWITGTHRKGWWPEDADKDGDKKEGAGSV